MNSGIHSEPQQRCSIVAKHLVKNYSYGEVVTSVLRGVSFSVPAGSFAALVGPSGCGKTTLLNLVGGLDSPDGGELIVAGNMLSSMSKRDVSTFRRETISFVFQFYNLLPTLTAQENVELAVSHLHLSRAEKSMLAQQMLEEVGLGGSGRRFPGQLSGGEQQRVAIARALVKRPQLVIADEPTGSLDQRAGRLVLDLMRRLNERHSISFFVVTHDLSLAREAFPVFRMEDGALLDGN